MDDRLTLALLLVVTCLSGFMLGYMAGWVDAPAVVRTVYVPVRKEPEPDAC